MTNMCVMYPAIFVGVVIITGWAQSDLSPLSDVFNLKFLEMSYSF